MGAQQSKSTSQTDIVSEALTEVLMKNAQKCKDKTNAIQSLTFEDIESPCPMEFSNISQNMKISTNFSCAQKGSNKSELMNQFKSKLDSEVDSKTSGIGGALYSSAESNTIARLTNKIKNNINIENIAECVSENLKTQEMKFNKIRQTGNTCLRDAAGNPVKMSFKDIAQSIVSEQISKCLQDNENISSSVTELDNILKSKTSSTLEGISPAVLSGGSASSFSFILISGVIAIIAFSAIGGDEE
jgi:hypothetical protein